MLETWDDGWFDEQALVDERRKLEEILIFDVNFNGVLQFFLTISLILASLGPR